MVFLLRSNGYSSIAEATMKKGIVSIIVSLIIFGPCFQTASQCFANDFLDTSTLADTKWDIYTINIGVIFR